MKPFKTIAYIQSLNLGKMNSTEMGEITILEEIGNNAYKVKINSSGVLCVARFNWFNCSYYADDVYEIIKE